MKKLLTLLFAGGLMLSAAGSAMATTGSSICTVKKVGPKYDYVELQLTGCNIYPTNLSANSWMHLQDSSTNVQNQQLATAVKSIEVDSQVAITWDDTLYDGSYMYIQGIAVVNPNL